MTQYSTACYFARQAASLCRFNGLSVSGFSRLPEALHGAIWQFIHADSGLVILLNSSGAVNAKATKAARDIAKAADLARLVASAKEAQALAAEIDSALADLDSAEKPAAGYGLRIVPRAAGFELHNDSGVWIGPGLGLFSTEAAARAWAEGRPAFTGGPRYWIKEEAPAAFDPAPAEVYQPGEKTPADHKAAAFAFIAAFALAPVTPALESPLFPMSQGAGLVALAIARGIEPTRLIAGNFGPASRFFHGGF